MAKPSKGSIVVKKKMWIPVIAPPIFNNAQIGETYLESPDLAIGRKMHVGLNTITGDPQRQNIQINFKIVKKQDNGLVTEVLGYSISPNSMRKMMRRRRSKIVDSFVVKTKDGQTVRIKPFVITRNKTTGSVRSALRRQLRVTIAKRVSELAFSDVIKELVARRFQRGINDRLRKVYPVQICEIKQFSIETSKKTVVVAPPVAEKPAAEVPKKEAPETA